MAIVVEEEKKNSSHVFAVAGWIVFLILIAVAGYYLFLAPPVAVSGQAAGALSSIAPLAQSPVQPQAVEKSAVLASLHSSAATPTSTGPAPVGRSNPFLAP